MLVRIGVGAATRSWSPARRAAFRVCVVLIRPFGEVSAALASVYRRLLRVQGSGTIAAAIGIPFVLFAWSISRVMFVAGYWLLLQIAGVDANSV
jgi:hypothetical protein